MNQTVNFDGLVGPTHNYAGLSVGNLASQAHKAAVSNPRAAALQGLAKMHRLMDLGCAQGFIPPLVCPDWQALHAWGFQGKPAQVLEKAYQQAPHLLAAAWSASSMWTANAATVTPSADTADRRVHFTPANLLAMPHRTIEARQTSVLLQRLFADEAYFAHHSALPGGQAFADEGAANHCRLVTPAGEAVHLFVYGRGHVADPNLHYPARQTRLACEAVARQHGLADEAVLYAQQSVAAINAGAFHNDVVAVSDGGTLLYHEQAFADETGLLAALTERLGDAFVPVRVNAAELSLAEAVRTYLFNSQIVTNPQGQQVLIAPIDVAEHPQAQAVVARILADDSHPIQAVEYPDVRESMRNGGGPACLRLRVVLNEAEQAAMQTACLLDENKWQALHAFVQNRYRDRLAFEDLRDVAFAEEVEQVVADLYGVWLV